MLIVAAGFVAAAHPYDSSSPAKFWLHFFAGLCVVLTIVFYALLVLRRKMIGAESARQVKHLSDLGRATRVAASIMLIASLLLFVIFAIDPVSVPQWLGMGTILFLAAAS